ncbi:hypothetical protein GYMLUDRAFT_238908 [Collybiopsis luxurians FD-317 M1]|nr:hypothetical protein GYMLUDRAFT_238908 [Collybiopsis luxurians FD-317 M1]
MLLKWEVKFGSQNPEELKSDFTPGTTILKTLHSNPNIPSTCSSVSDSEYFISTHSYPIPDMNRDGTSLPLTPLHDQNMDRARTVTSTSVGVQIDSTPLPPLLPTRITQQPIGPQSSPHWKTRLPAHLSSCNSETTPPGGSPWVAHK